jgi:hypothetical protein
MSIEQLFDHVAELYPASAPGSTVVDDYGDNAPAFGDPVTEDCAVVPPQLSEKDFGAGQTPAGHMNIYLRMGVTLNNRDVVKLIEGPEAPSTWLADNVTHPRGHHTEAVLIPWTGTPTP